MPSATVQLAATTAVKARTINNGQSCIAAKRFILHRDIADEFEKRFVVSMQALKLGDPMDESTEVGPLATPQIVSAIQTQGQRSVAAGAWLLLRYSVAIALAASGILSGFCALGAASVRTRPASEA